MYPNYNYFPQNQQPIRQQPPMQNQGILYLKGRPVSSIEEVKAIPIDFDGSIFIFPDIANKQIYTKQINLDGTASINVYELKILQQPTAQPQMTDYITRDEFNEQMEKIRAIFAGQVQEQAPQQTIADMQNANTINAGITNLGTQLQQCCCQNRYEDAQNFAQLNYNLADQECSTRRTVSDATRDLMENQNANTRSVLGAIQEMQTQALHDKISELTAANSNLRLQASQAAQNSYLINALNPTPIPAYTVANPYSGYHNCGCNTL